MDPISAIWQSLPLLLYTFWGLATLAAVVALLPIDLASGFRKAVLVSACRGKLWEGKPSGALGQLTEWKVPQAWFAHFYDVGVIANAVTLYLNVRYSGWSQGPVLVALGLLQLHLLRRCLETHFMMRYPQGSLMHAFAYAFGLAYYAVLPLTCLPPAIFKESFKDVLGASASQRAHPLQTFNKWHLLGVLVFLAGNALQFDSHRILARLSGQPQRLRGAGDAEHYRIPYGGGFQWVSCPHYLAEMVIYLGLTLLLDLRRPLSYLPYFWVVANLLLAAGPTHSWYKRKFEKYPPSRKAVIPFVY